MDRVLYTILPPLLMWAVLIAALWNPAKQSDDQDTRDRFRPLLRFASVLFVANLLAVAVVVLLMHFDL